ncbi:hypothetical protein [Romboutsia sp. 13368]|uniref:hypothetical protein n=1 Tax=Romboutsia sp. 13368 TaxID=2708053 RepID=UPI0025D3B44B|nr:hypothetical protein [Romboutsia sp. 13368]
MRGTYNKHYFREINKQLIIIGLIFLTAVVMGTYLNKIWPDYQSKIVTSVNPIVEYYSSNISVRNIVMANLKSDISFMMGISLTALLVVTFPLALLNFLLKGISMGYTINSIILAMKLKSIKFILITISKNLIIIVGSIILILISINYIKEIVFELKKNKNKSNIKFLFSRYILNSIIVLAITIGLQALLNTVIISIIKFLVI